MRQFQRLDDRQTSADPAALTEYIDARLRRLVANPMAGFTAADRLRVLLVTAWLVGRLQPQDLVEVPIHGDLSPSKITVDSSQLTVLECTSGRRGLALHDLASIQMHIGLFASDHRYSSALIREVQRKFLHAFDSTLDLQRPALRVALLLNVVNHYSLLAAQRTASVAALSDWRTMRRHRSWLRRLEQRRPRGGSVQMNELIGSIRRTISPAAKTLLFHSGVYGAIRRAVPEPRHRDPPVPRHLRPGGICLRAPRHLHHA